MKETKMSMGMPITVEIVSHEECKKEIEKIFLYFEYIDKTFSTYKEESEISMINRGIITPTESSEDIKTIFTLAEETKNITEGYFNIQKPDGSYDPSGIVKGWAIWNAAKILTKDGYHNFFVDAGGDIQVSGRNSTGDLWSIGIRNPFNTTEIVKVVSLDGKGIATSGVYVRGQHIYNPHTGQPPASHIVSISVIGPNVYEADRFATAAFAMGSAGINYIEGLDGFEGYAIDSKGIAVQTSGFESHVKK